MKKTLVPYLVSCRESCCALGRGGFGLHETAEPHIPIELLEGCNGKVACFDVAPDADHCGLVFVERVGDFHRDQIRGEDPLAREIPPDSEVLVGEGCYVLEPSRVEVESFTHRPGPLDRVPSTSPRTEAADGSHDLSTRRFTKVFGEPFVREVVVAVGHVKVRVLGPLLDGEIWVDPDLVIAQLDFVWSELA